MKDFENIQFVFQNTDRSISCLAAFGTDAEEDGRLLQNFGRSGEVMNDSFRISWSNLKSC